MYAKARRQYTPSRTVRSLAVWGDQIQAMVSIHGGILEFGADLADPKRRDKDKKEDLKQFVVIRPEDASKEGPEQAREALADYLKDLAPSLELAPTVDTQATPLKRRSRLGIDSWIGG